MNVITTARHCELDAELRLFAQQRLEKLERFAHDIQEVHVILTAEGGYRHSAEISLKLKRGEMLSREESTEARAAIDLAADRLEQRLRRLKERRASRQRTRLADVAGLEAAGDADRAAESGTGRD